MQYWGIIVLKYHSSLGIQIWTSCILSGHPVLVEYQVYAVYGTWSAQMCSISPFRPLESVLKSSMFLPPHKEWLFKTQTYFFVLFCFLFVFLLSSGACSFIILFLEMALWHSSYFSPPGRPLKFQLEFQINNEYFFSVSMSQMDKWNQSCLFPSEL